MNHVEAAQVLATMAAVHPWDVTSDQAEVWYQAALHPVGLDEGLAVAMRIVETDERFPTPARFLAVRDELRRAAYLAQRDAAQDSGRLLDPGATVEEHARASIAALRATIASSETRGHWHGGPKACPVCGGISPDAYRRLDQRGRDAADTARAQIVARHR